MINKIMSNVQQAGEWLKQGHLLVYPTESVWGIGCDPFSESAVQHILNLKQRPIEKGMIVVTDSVIRLTPLLNNLNDNQRNKVVASWQENSNTRQAQTWLLPLFDSSGKHRVNIPKWITGEHDSVAVRVIAHPLVKQLCEQVVSQNNPFGFIVSTSCNPSGKKPAKNFEDAYAYFGEQKEQEFKVGFLEGDTLGYTLPSKINSALTGRVVR